MIDENKKFLVIEAAIFTFLAAFTLLEIFDYLFFKELFMRMSEYLSWFLGLTVATVVPDWISMVKYRIDRMMGRFLPNERFVFFFMNLIFMTVTVALAKQLAIFFMKRYFEFFHIIITQWLVVVYIWFKFVHDFKINLRYVIAAEILVILFSMIITLSL